jgi:DNA-binding MarR family transcriptional regulator
MTGLYDAAFEPSGLNIAQYRLMTVIRDRPGISLTEFAAVLDLDRSTVSRNIQVLARRDLVNVSAGTDGRETILDVSARGAATLVVAQLLWQMAQGRVVNTLGAVATTAILSLMRSMGSSPDWQ